MLNPEAIFVRLIFLSVMGTVDFVLLIGGYGVLRLLRISVNWVTWVTGTLLIAASVLFCLSVLLPNHFLGETHASGNLLGLVSFLVAVHSASQWTARQWYVRVRKSTASLLVGGSRNFLLFLRRHHVFLGWVVALTAISHTVDYLPILANI